MKIVLIWVASIMLGWERFHWMQLVGFIIMVTGSLCYNEIIEFPFCRPPRRESEYKSVSSDHILATSEGIEISKNQN